MANRHKSEMQVSQMYVGAYCYGKCNDGCSLWFISPTLDELKVDLISRQLRHLYQIATPFTLTL
ncbi:MAG: hypothetical protein NC217_07920 [Muribaculaceae bacterium]|nr:hypothetical protein [Muribaculaceae bacterium]